MLESTMPIATMETRSIPSIGNEYGITNVSSQGRVSITVVPPRPQRSRSQTPFDHVVNNLESRQHINSISDGSSRATERLRSDTSSYRSHCSEVSGSSHGSSTTHSQPTGRDLSDTINTHSLQELRERKQRLLDEGHEQNELDEILRELLGDTQSSAGPTSSSRRQGSSSITTQDSRGRGASSDGNGWLEQQQRKLSQRQLSRDQEDIGQLHRQQKQLVSELKHVQTTRKESLTDDFNSNNLFRTEQIVPCASQEPSAYTVFIKPEEFREPPKETTNVSKKSLTNVSHTHHTHYNFQDNGDDVFESDMRQTMEDQKRRILQLEDELRNVKKGLEQQPPPRLQKLNFDDEEDEEYLFKPVGIASLESGTVDSVKARPTRLPSVTSASSPAITSSASFPMNATTLTTTTQRDASPGQSTLQTHTLQSQQSVYSVSNAASPPALNRIPVSPSPFVTMVLPSPRTPYQLMSPLTSPFADLTGTAGRQQRRILEERVHQQQHVYQQQPSTGGSQIGTLPSQSSLSQRFDNGVTRQQSTTAQHSASSSFGFANHNTAASLTSPIVTEARTMPLNQALHINTNDAQANSSGVIYSTIVGTDSPGHVQFINDRSRNMNETEQSPLAAKFVKDTSKYWYKPLVSRDEGAFGLAVKVAQLPPNVQTKPGASDPAADYVRFYLIEPTTKGVKLKGCTNEPVFASLASLIYQHTITPLALPCKLLLPDPDQYEFGGNSRHLSSASGGDVIDGPALDHPGMVNGSETISTAADLLKRGAACSVVYMNNVDTEALTGPQAVSRAVHHTFGKEVLETTIATIKVSTDGITITDNHRKIFFRQHFPRDSISYCGVDPADRRFTQNLENTAIQEAKIFGFVARRKGGNQCLLFAELDPEQPASAIVTFVNKVLLGPKG